MSKMIYKTTNIINGKTSLVKLGRPLSEEHRKHISEALGGTK